MLLKEHKIKKKFLEIKTNDLILRELTTEDYKKKKKKDYVGIIK